MITKSVLAGSVLILTLVADVATAFVLWFLAGRTVPPPLAAVSLTPEAPATIVISCERGKTSGLTIYPRYSEYCRDSHCTLIEGSDVAPEPALFARCRPDEDFTYDVKSTRAEITESSRRPEDRKSTRLNSSHSS